MRPGSDQLFQHLRDRHDLIQLTADLEPPSPLQHADQYLCASALQKAIRRGDLAIARRAAHQLIVLDRQRLWRRLAVIALEDIGIADITVAAELVAISTMAQARRVLGGDLHALDIALVRACRAAKDRSGDHLASIVGREPVDAWDEAALKTASPNALLAMLASSHLPWTRRVRAALIASGRSDDPVHSTEPDIAAVFDVLHERGVPLPLIVACEAYAARQRDALPVLVPFAWLLRAGSSTEPHVVAHDLPTPELIGETPDYVFDPLWTRIGKHAVELFVRSHLMKPPFTARMVAAALWNAESALCDRTLSWPFGDELRQRAYRADLLARGVPPDRHAELNAWIESERPALFAARVAAWNSAVRASGQVQEPLSQPNLPLPVPGARRRDV